MSNLSKSQAVALTTSILQSTTRNYINIPDEFINYAAAASLYVTRNWPGDTPLSNLPNASARGPEMANAIQQYVTLCAKTLSFRFTRTGTWNLTADPGIANDGQDVLNQQSWLPMPGAVAQYQAYRPVNNGATGNGLSYAALSTFRQISGPGSFIASGTYLYLTESAGEWSQSNTVYQMDIADKNTFSRFAITGAGYDDWTGLIVNGVYVGVWSRYMVAYGLTRSATNLQLLAGGIVDLGAVGQIAINAGPDTAWQSALNVDVLPYLHNGTNTFELRYINYKTVVNCFLTFDVVQNVAGPGLYTSQLIPDAPGYAAVVSGNASYSALVNLLNNLAGKLYNYMVNNVYQISYCHTNCHNNCHSSRGRR